MLCTASSLLAGCDPFARATGNQSDRRPGRSRGANAGANARVIGVDLNRSKATDANLALMQFWPDLVSINLSGTAITDQGLATIAQFTQLTKLNLTLTKITDAGLRTSRT